VLILMLIIRKHLWSWYFM